MKFSFNATKVLDFILVGFAAYLGFHKPPAPDTVPNLLVIAIVLLVVGNWNTDKIK